MRYIPGFRVYEYKDDDGNTYWSFTMHRPTVSPPKRLILQSRVGTHLINFLAFMRRRGEELKAESAGKPEDG